MASQDMLNGAVMHGVHPGTIVTEQVRLLLA
jgi:hypothetical protein